MRACVCVDAMCVCVWNLGRAWFVSYRLWLPLLLCLPSARAITYNFCARLASMEFAAIVAATLAILASAPHGRAAAAAQLQVSINISSSSSISNQAQRASSLFPFRSHLACPPLASTLTLLTLSFSLLLRSCLRARSCRVLHWLPFVTPRWAHDIRCRHLWGKAVAQRRSEKHIPIHI